ncbi:protein phtf isoform X2 [Toxorhynchites rutilus septentrionalis]|uniref:protein phtf isoform X2 n=1 Tax=Toxorhynchites rutilus septentrionalis TaxID=329112 RepID=UPI00247A7DA2|nr:protein phtf isoform X2 [Toxorhynchites rutilus septentrionalis]
MVSTKVHRIEGCLGARQQTMRLDELVAWYQKKIGTYDKQQWEKTIEQKILAGIDHLPLKNTKLKTELIDVDLVRGSTFPKAKSKLSILTVIYLASVRLLFLPVYAKWWVQQTSPKVFVLLLTLYLLQMVNLGIYSYNVNKAGAEQEEHIVAISDFLIPMALSLLLSVIHSQIVATASNNSTLSHKVKKCHSHSTLKKRERIRRKRRFRASYTNVGESMSTVTVKSSSCDQNQESKHVKSVTASPTRRNKKQGACSTSSSTSNETLDRQRIDKSSVDAHSKVQNNVVLNVVTKRSPIEKLGESDRQADGKNRIIDSQGISNMQPEQSDDDRDDSVFLQESCHMNGNDLTSTNPREVLKKESFLPTDSCCTLRKRNVNWDPQVSSSNTSRTKNEDRSSVDAPVDDDGFESLNGKSSGGEDSSNPGVPTATYFKNISYSNTWTSTCPQLEKETKSDSDTDTLRNTPTSQEPTCSAPSTTMQLGKCRPHLSSESGIELQRHKRKSQLDDDHLPHTVAGQSESKEDGFEKTLESSGDTDEENDSDPQHNDAGHHQHHLLQHHSHHHHHQHLSEGEDCSYSSDLNHSDGQNEHSDDDYDLEDAPTIILNPPCGATDRVSCTIWEAREAKKAEMSVLDISSAIIERVEAMPETCDYVYIGVVLSLILSLIPAFCRLCEAIVDPANSTELSFLEMPVLLLEKASFSCIAILRFALGDSTWEKTVLILGFVLRLCLTYLLFFLLAVAERTFKQRFLYAKLFSHLTSSRRARQSGIPHFRLNKVRNIKTWLCVRSYLKRRGPQNSVDVIVSAAFIITLILLAFLSVEWLKDSVHLHSQCNLEALVWSCAFGAFLLRFMTLGTKINKKYKSVSVLITEQINLYVQIEQKPNKKEELMISNNVLKLAADLLKELESPFKISGLSANPYLYTTVKVVILSALSGVLSEMLGFKLKLHKIKIK